MEAAEITTQSTPRSGPVWAGAVRHAAILFAFGVAALLFSTGASLLNDPDTQWHIAVGRLMWTTGEVPQTDVFSHTFAGAPWMAKEWLSQLVLFAAFSAAGWWGVTMLTVLAIATSFALLFAWLLRRIRPVLALGLVLIALCLAAPSIVARPHILVMPVVILWMTELVSSRDRGRAPRWWAPGLMILWANMHASYPLGLALAGLMAAEAFAASRPDNRRDVVLQWGTFVVVSALAACVTPYGARILLVGLTVFQTAEITDYVSEWHPIGLDEQGLIAVAAVFTATAVLVRAPKQNAFRLAAVLLLGYMMVRHVRFSLLFGMLTPVLIAGPVSRAFPNASAERFRIPHPRLAFAAVAAVALAAAGLMRPEPSPLVTPSAALRFARDAGLSGRVYNDYDYGGFLILNRVKTFIDGRNDQLFAGGFSNRLSEALAAPDNAAFAAILDREHVTWALVKRTSPDAKHLAGMEGWSELFSSGDAAVYARTCGARICAGT